MTLIVVWNRMWDMPLSIPADLPADCNLSFDRDLAPEADAVVFHLPSLNPAFILKAAITKPAGQAWVAWSLESEVHYPCLSSAQFMAHFEIRMTYRLDSDIPVTYVPGDFQARLADAEVQRCAFDRRHDVLANAFISSAFDRSGRRPLLEALMQRMVVDSFGRVARTAGLGQVERTEEFKLKTIAAYKFTLVFENACSPDYVTEKFFQPLLVGSVPVVLGAPNIADFAPGEHCFVDVRDFPTVSALVATLEAIGRDPASYERFHAWRSQPLRPAFLDLMRREQDHPFVRLCRLLQSRSRSRCA